MSPTTLRPEIVDTRSGPVVTLVRHAPTKHNNCCAQRAYVGPRKCLVTTGSWTAMTCSGLATTVAAHPREGGPRPRKPLSRPRDFYKFLAIATR